MGVGACVCDCESVHLVKDAVVAVVTHQVAWGGWWALHTWCYPNRFISWGTSQTDRQRVRGTDTEQVLCNSTLPLVVVTRAFLILVWFQLTCRELLFPRPWLGAPCVSGACVYTRSSIVANPVCPLRNTSHRRLCLTPRTHSDTARRAGSLSLTLCWPPCASNGLFLAHLMMIFAVAEALFVFANQPWATDCAVVYTPCAVWPKEHTRKMFCD